MKKFLILIGIFLLFNACTQDPSILGRHEYVILDTLSITNSVGMKTYNVLVKFKSDSTIHYGEIEYTKLVRVNIRPIKVN